MLRILLLPHHDQQHRVCFRILNNTKIFKKTNNTVLHNVSVTEQSCRLSTKIIRSLRSLLKENNQLLYRYSISNTDLEKWQISKHLCRKRDNNNAKGRQRNLNIAHECLCGLGLQATHPRKLPLK